MAQITSKTMYEKDFALWVEDTVNKLKARNLDALLTEKFWEMKKGN